MKTKIFKKLTLAICAMAFSFTTNAQLPDFTRVDTGAISQLLGGHYSSTCFDMDNDGDLDIASANTGVYVTNRMFSIYKNERNGYYLKMPEIESNHYDLSSIGDIDNDGDIDLSTGLPTNNANIYTNNGYGRYQSETSFNLWFSTVYHTLLDVNNDGFLDYLGIDKEGSVAINNGNGGFLPVTGLGVFQQLNNAFLNGVSWGDPDNDGDFDFYGGYTSFSGAIQTNVCFLNNGNGSFTQFDPTSVIVEGTCGTPSANWVDYDNDGDMDLYVNNTMCANSLPALYENLGDMQFIRHVIIDEIYRYSQAVSTVWGDLDNDADLDLFISVENNEFPWGGGTSATPYNIIYLNEGNGQFTDILEHPLTVEDTHTAMLFDHDNDGDLDVLMTRYSFVNNGYNNLFVNEGNDNSWMVLTCEGTTSNRSAIGTRVQAKCFVNGEHITQTREITPINGHASWANLRVHFGLGEANVIDTLIIRWPSELVDTYLDVAANHFYRAIEDDKLEIDFKATNYIQYNPGIADLNFEEIGENTTIDLQEHYRLITGDTVPVINGDTLEFSVYNNENPGVVKAEVNGSNLILEADTLGETIIHILARTEELTKRLDQFKVKVGVGLDEYTLSNPIVLNASPSLFSDEVTIAYEIPTKSKVKLEILNYNGQLVANLINEVKQKGKHEMLFNGSELSAGIYFCVLKTNPASAGQTIKMIKL